MSKVRIATVTAGLAGRARIAYIEAGVATVHSNVRIAYVQAGVPTGPEEGLWVSTSVTGDDWIRSILFTWTGEAVTEAPAPIGWRMVGTDIGRAWVPGVIRPDLPNMSGVPSGVSLTAVGSTINVDDAGPSSGNAPWSGTGTQSDPYLLYRLSVAGSIVVRTDRFVRVEECDVHPTLIAGANDGIIRCTSGNIPHSPDQVTIIRSDIHQATGVWGNSGIFGHGWTSIRNHIYHVEDGLASLTATSPATNAYVTSMGDLVDNLVYCQGVDQGGTNANPGGVDSPSSHKLDGSHSDQWQIQGGSYHTAIGTYFRGQFDSETVGGVTPWIRKTMSDNTASGNGHNYYGSLAANSAVQINQNQSWAAVNNVSITKCWVDGGRYSSINYAAENYGSYGTFDNHTIQDNTFYRNTGWTDGYWTGSDAVKTLSRGYPVNLSGVSGLYDHIAWGGNKWYDTGVVIDVYSGDNNVVGAG